MHGHPISKNQNQRTRFFSNSNGEREEMEHAIGNKEIGFIVFSKLTSHDWAQHPALVYQREFTNESDIEDHAFNLYHLLC